MSGANTTEELIKELQALGKRKPLSKDNLGRAKEIMVELKRSGYSAKEISELSDGGWSEASVKSYTSGTQVRDSSSKLKLTSSMMDLIRRGIQFDQITDLADTMQQLDSMGFTVEDVSTFLTEAGRAKLSAQQLFDVLGEVIASGLSAKDLVNALGAKHELDSSGLGLDKAKLLADTAKKFGPVDEVLTAVDRYGSLKAIEADIAGAEAQKAELSKGVQDEKKKLDDLEQEHDRLDKGIEGLEGKKSDLEDNITEQRKVKGRLLKENKTTEAELRSFLDDKEFLLSIGLDTGDHEATTRVLRSMERLKYKPSSVVARLRSIDSLEGSITHLQGEQARLTESIDAEKGDLKQVEGELARKHQFLLEVRRLEKVGVDLSGVAEIRKKVVAISAGRSLTSTEAMKRFLEDIVKNYDIVLGVEANIRKLRTDEADLGRQIKTAEEQLRIIEGQVNSRKEEWDAFVSLIKRVNGDTLVGWKAIIVEAGLDPELVTDELEKYRSLAQSCITVKAELHDLKKRRDVAKSELDALQTNKEELVASIKTIKEEAISQLESHKERVDQSVKGAEKSFADLVNSLDVTAKKAIETGETIGRLGALKPAITFFNTGEVTREEGLIVTLRMAKMLGPWASKNGLLQIAALSETLQMEIQGELKKVKK